MELRRRYQSLYIPSDFFGAVFTWVDAFPMTRPFQLNNACNFHILHKEVDPLAKNTAVLDPPDANHTYSAKVRVTVESVPFPLIGYLLMIIRIRIVMNRYILRIIYGRSHWGSPCFAGDVAG